MKASDWLFLLLYVVSVTIIGGMLGVLIAVAMNTQGA